MTLTYPLIVQPVPLTRKSERYRRDARLAVFAWMDECLIRDRNARLAQPAYLPHYREWHKANMPDLPLASSGLLTSALGTLFPKYLESKRARPVFIGARLRVRARRRQRLRQRPRAIERLRMSQPQSASAPAPAPAPPPPRPRPVVAFADGSFCICPDKCLDCALDLHYNCMRSQCDPVRREKERERRKAFRKCRTS